MRELKRIRETKEESNKVFKFGESSYKAKCVMELPVVLKDRKFYLRTEILQGDIPWLIGKKTMSRMGMRIDMKDNVVEIEALGGIKVRLREDEQGHLTH